MAKEYKLCTELIGLSPEILRNYDKDIVGNIYLVKRQVMLRCPRTNELIPENECLHCSHNFGKSSEKWIYCALETTKIRGNR